MSEEPTLTRTPEQIENSRRVLFQIFGPYALWMKPKQIDDFMNELQLNINKQAIQNADTEEDVYLTEFIDEINPTDLKALHEKNIKTIRDFILYDKQTIRTIMSEAKYFTLLELFIQEIQD